MGWLKGGDRLNVIARFGSSPAPGASRALGGIAGGIPSLASASSRDGAGAIPADGACASGNDIVLN